MTSVGNVNGAARAPYIRVSGDFLYAVTDTQQAAWIIQGTKLVTLVAPVAFTPTGTVNDYFIADNSLYKSFEVINFRLATSTITAGQILYTPNTNEVVSWDYSNSGVYTVTKSFKT